MQIKTVKQAIKLISKFNMIVESISNYNAMVSMIDSFPIYYSEWSGWSPVSRKLPSKSDMHTYNECVKLKFSVDNNQLFVTFMVYEGNILDGKPTEMRCYFRFLVTNENMYIVGQFLNRIMYEYAVSEYENELAQARINRIAELMDTLL